MKNSLHMFITASTLLSLTAMCACCCVYTLALRQPRDLSISCHVFCTCKTRGVDHERQIIKLSYRVLWFCGPSYLTDTTPACLCISLQLTLLLMVSKAIAVVSAYVAFSFLVRRWLGKESDQEEHS